MRLMDDPTCLKFDVMPSFGPPPPSPRHLLPQEATKANPQFAAAYTNLGTIYQNMKQNEKARYARLPVSF